MEAIASMVAMSGALAASPALPDVGVPLWQSTLRLTATADQVAHAWSRALAADVDGSWSDPILRGIFLASLAANIEIGREANADVLNAALRQLTTLTGARLNLIGTRKEAFSRAAEALFKEARRKPVDALFQRMLLVAETLFTVVIADYGHAAKIDASRRWYGMRGVCRLLLATRRKASGGVVGAQDWMDAAADLEFAFQSGNRGASAATYLLDALMHALEYDPLPDGSTSTRIVNAVAMLEESELASRSVRALVARYRFACSFHEADPASALQAAAADLDAALQFPAQLAYEDHFVRHVRGQVGVRLALALENAHPQEADDVGAKAAEDLLWAITQNAAAYGSHSSLPSFLITRAQRLARVSDFEGARRDLALILEDPRLKNAPQDTREQAAGRMHQVALEEGIRLGDAVRLESALRASISAAPQQGLSWLVVALAAKRLIAALPKAALDRQLLHDLLARLRASPPDSSWSVEHLRQHQSHVAGLTMYLAREEPALLGIALQDFDSALSLHDGFVAPPELLALRADCQLQNAKRMVTLGQDVAAEDLLEEAAATFLLLAQQGAGQGQDGAFRHDVAFSKAGEAYHRLAGLSNVDAHVRTAIDCFEISMRHGNDSHQVHGLLGDSCYRLFRMTRSGSALERAIELKMLARQRGGESRENLSVSARLHHMKWQMSGDERDLVESASLVAQAAALDPGWPWPPFQLHDYLERLDAPARASVLERARELHPQDPLLGVAASEGLEGLARAACERVLENDEFQRKSLGGRKTRDVYILDDPHGLLGTSYVFKHTDRQNAQRDVDAVRGFFDYMTAKGLTGLALPDTVALLPEQAEGGGVIHVMRRSRGAQLGRVAVQAARAGVRPDTRPLASATTHLAAYHAWGEAVNPRRPPKLPH